jgi:uncharacterized damage-inducible protein DinB
MPHQILVKLAKSRESLLRVVADLSEETLDLSSGDGGWTIRNILTHVLNAEEDHCQVIAVVADGQADRLPATLVLDEHNERRVAERGRMSHQALLDALAEQRRRTEALFNRLSADQLGWVAHHPVLGEKTLDEIFRILSLHDRLHTKEITAILEGA